MSIRQLAGQTAIYGISSIVSRFLNYLLTPLLTRVLTPSEYGVITDLYALIPFAMVLLTMGMETGYFRFAGKAENEQARRSVFATSWGAVSLVSFVFLGLAIGFRPQLAALTGYQHFPSYLSLTAVIIALDAITAIPFARLRQEGKATRFVIVRTLSVLLNVVLVVFFYVALTKLAESGNFWQSLYHPAYGPGYYLVANVITSVVTLGLLFPTYRGIVPRIRWETLRPLAVYSFPLLISGIAGVSNLFIDRQLIKYLMPPDVAMDALGIYGAVAKLGVILLLFIQMYRYAAEPYFLSGFNKQDFRRSNAEALKYFVFVSVGIFLLIMFFPEGFAWLVGPAFRQGLGILPIILTANIFSGMTLNLNFWYKQAEQTRYAVWITGSGLLFTIGLNIWLIPIYGYVGAAWARLACEFVMLALSYYLNQKHYPTPYNLTRIGGYFLMGILLFGCSFLTGKIPGIGKYIVNLALLSGYLYTAIRLEKINLGGLFRSISKR